MEDLDKMEASLVQLRARLDGPALDERTRALYRRLLDHMSVIKDTLGELEDVLNETNP